MNCYQQHLTEIEDLFKTLKIKEDKICRSWAQFSVQVHCTPKRLYRTCTVCHRRLEKRLKNLGMFFLIF